MSAATARALNDRLVQFERETSNQVLVFIDRRIPPDTTLEELGAATIRQWGVGQKDKDNGVIFFVFIDDRKMRIEVGYGLEPTLTDARSKRITSQIVKPLFQQKKYEEGIEAGAQAIMDVTRGGDDAAAAPAQSSVWPMIFFFALTTVCLAFLIYVLRSLMLFMQGAPSLLFRAPSKYGWLGGGGGGGSGSGGSSDSWGGSDSSSGSFSSGGGDGGGGGSSDSW